MTGFTISSSILSADFACLANQIQQAEEAGIDRLHIDVMDGSFVPNISMGAFIVETCRRITSLPLDVHLMIINPERHLEAFARAGATSILVHIENTPHIFRILQSIHGLGCQAGIVLNPGTPAAAIEAVLSQVDQVLVMTVNPGFAGQEIIPEMNSKINRVASLIQSSRRDIRLAVDGGVSETTLPDLYIAGADTFVAATAIFKHPGGITAGVKALQAAVPA